LGVNATADDVALLYGRAAFGATKNDLTVWTGQKYTDVVDALVVPATPVPLPQADDWRRVELSQNANDKLAAERWFLQRMASTTVPLVERMTYFWHTHFATAYNAPPDVGHLINQNQTIRTYALGDLRQLLYNLTIDGAMLYWLSGVTNRRGAINENYGRELFELFTMGTIPQTYTETDIRQAAKALSGWTVNATTRLGQFTAARHDTSVKTVFGEQVGGYKSGSDAEKVEYQEIVDLALKQPTTAKFIAYKMVCSFAYVPSSRNLIDNPDPLVDAVAATLRPATPDGVWDIGAAMKVLLNHDRFRYPDRAAGQAIVRSPIETTVHLGKVTGVSLDPPAGIQNTNAANANQAIYALRRMGQVPFEPPNVGGWPRGTGWLSAITAQARYDLTQYVLTAYGVQNKQKTNPLPASTDIAGWTSFLGLGHLSTVTRSRLDAYLASPGTTAEATKQNSVLFLLTSSPDWQVM
jgi:uncharacterized protein (DUF1800 family)